MKTNITETKSQKFMRMGMGKTWSIPFHVKLMIQYKRSWRDGLTSRELLKKVKRSLKDAGYIKKSNRLKVDSIYGSVGKINDLHCPPFYIDCKGRLISNGKYEYRYFVPYTDGDIQEAKGKQIRMGQKKFHRAKQAEDFGEEIEKEKEKEKMFQPQPMVVRN